jgi:hypothetical protein
LLFASWHATSNHSILSTQHSALSTQHSALSTFFWTTGDGYSTNDY